MAILTPLSAEAAWVFLSDYEGGAPSVPKVTGISAGTVNSSFALDLPTGRRFLRIYEEQDKAGADTEVALLRYLAAQDIVTPAPLPRRDGTLVGTIAGKPAALFPWVPGETRCLSRVSAEDARRVGRELARLHLAGLKAPARAGRFEPEALHQRLLRVAAARDATLAAQAEFLGSALDAWTARRDPTLPRGLVHGDLFRDNVLWDERGSITALLDFESASAGVLAYDLMVTILAWCVRDDLAPELARSMVGGYREVRDLTDAERGGLLAEGCIACLRFTVTRITDDALRALETGTAPRADKDWRRFAMRRARLESLGEPGLRALLGL